MRAREYPSSNAPLQQRRNLVRCNQWLGFRRRRLKLHQDISDLAGGLRHRPSPTSKRPVRIDGLSLFIQIPALYLVLLGFLTLRLQQEHVTVCETHEKVGPVLPHDTFINIQDFEA